MKLCRLTPIFTFHLRPTYELVSELVTRDRTSEVRLFYRCNSRSGDTSLVTLHFRCTENRKAGSDISAAHLRVSKISSSSAISLVVFGLLLREGITSSSDFGLILVVNELGKHGHGKMGCTTAIAELLARRRWRGVQGRTTTRRNVQCLARLKTTHARNPAPVRQS